jgi:stage II sporulation protein AB (anti-sigma F factor)
MNIKDEIKLIIPSKSSNESFARMAVGAFVSRLDPTLEELNDIKTAVSEAVTNCIVHAYKDTIGKIYITVSIDGQVVKIKIKDCGCGINDVTKAMEPLFTTGGEERAGLGFAVMESFMDRLKVRSIVDKGTTVIMQKKLKIKYDKQK